MPDESATSKAPDLDVLVVGGGPAGTALAAACTERGLAVAVLDPAPEAPWPNHYGIWLADLEPLGLADTLAHRWAGADIQAGGHHRVDRAYGSVSNSALRARLDHAPRWRGALATLEHHATGSAALLADGRRFEARLVVNATGRPLAPAAVPAWQTAYGQLIEVEAHPYDLAAVGLMDFSAVPGAPEHPPTFLYALPFGPHRLFVEETILAGPVVPFADLATRLAARLAHLGIVPRAVLAEEQCLIPMGLPVPKPDRLVAFGAAAGLIHPATGYSLGHSLRLAGSVAEAIATHLPEGPDAAARAAYAATWPREKQRLWTVYRFGLQVLLGLDLRETQAFFGAFFTLPADLQQGWLAGTLPISEATRAMRGVFARLPAGLKARLIGHSFLPQGWRLLGALMR